MGQSRSFWRTSNIMRLLGLSLLLAGGFMPQSNFTGAGFAGTTNLIQIAGAILLFYPMIREFFQRPKV